MCDYFPSKGPNCPAMHPVCDYFPSRAGRAFSSSRKRPPTSRSFYSLSKNSLTQLNPKNIVQYQIVDVHSTYCTCKTIRYNVWVKITIAQPVIIFPVLNIQYMESFVLIFKITIKKHNSFRVF